MGSRERMILRFVIWVIERYFSKEYRLMTPSDLNQVVDNYLAQLPELGIRLVKDSQPEGVSNDEIATNSSSVLKEDKLKRRPRTRKTPSLEG